MPDPGPRPLIVAADDDVDTLNIIKTKLEHHGLQVLTVRDGQEALAVIRKHHPALAILDVMMPRLNGFQVARMIKFDKHMKDIPVILLTARTQDADRQTGQKVGANDYMTKPFDAQKLLERVLETVKRPLASGLEPSTGTGSS